MGMMNNLVTWLKEKTFLRKLVLRNTSLFKRAIWDYEYRSGDWDYIDHPPAEHFSRIIEEYLKGGSILDLGCGTGKTILALSAFSRFTGIDVSTVATDKGREDFRDRDNVFFVAADIATYEDKERYDVVLWSEVINYFDHDKIVPVLHRYKEFLTEGGVQIVQLYSKEQQEAVVALIRSNFTIIAEHETEDREGNRSIVLVF